MLYDKRSVFWNTWVKAKVLFWHAYIAGLPAIPRKGETQTWPCSAHIIGKGSAFFFFFFLIYKIPNCGFIVIAEFISWRWYHRLIFICNFGNVNEVPSLIAQLLFYFRNNRGFSLEINQPPGFYDVHSRCWEWEWWFWMLAGDPGCDSLSLREI